MNRRRMATVIAAILLPVGAGASVASSPAAHASTYPVSFGNNYCTGTNFTSCANQWNGGPFVNSWHAPSANGDFVRADGVGGNQYLADSNNSSAWENSCIGDAYNDPNNARVSLNPCPGATGSSGSGDGWGTHVEFVTSICQSGLVAIKDLHWNGWFGPSQDGVDGSAFYLNKPTAWCFRLSGWL